MNTATALDVVKNGFITEVWFGDFIYTCADKLVWCRRKGDPCWELPAEDQYDECHQVHAYFQQEGLL